MSRPFLAIFALATLFITTHALPLQNTVLVKRANSGIIIGYRAVREVSHIFVICVCSR